MKWKEKCHKAISTKPRRPRGCQISTSRLCIAVHPPGTPNVLQSPCERCLPSRHLAVFWTPQIRFYFGCASLRRLGRPGSAPPRQGFHPGISVAFRLRRSSPRLIQLRIPRARDKKVRDVWLAAVQGDDARERKLVSRRRWTRPWGLRGLGQRAISTRTESGDREALEPPRARRFCCGASRRGNLHVRMSAPARPIAIPWRLAISSLTAVQ
jgi:hypothetical protein